MATAKNFLKLTKNDSFKKTPFCEADFLVLTALSYADFKNSLYFDEKSINGLVPLNVFAKNTVINKLKKNYLTIGKGYTQFLNSFFSSNRYKDAKVGYFRDEFSLEDNMQFFALTFYIDNKYLIVFRGTDNTITGWKEDFNMALMDKIPGQKMARDYVRDVLKKVKGKIYISGHSKGGNLAYYCYLNLNKRERSRVISVFNYDGPGFKNDNYDYSEYGTKMFKFVPEDDVFGMIFDTSNKWEIIPSTRINMGAHDLLTWKLDRKTRYTQLQRLKSLTIYSSCFNQTFNEWYYKTDPKDAEALIKFVFKLVETNNISTLGGLFKDILFAGDEYYREIENYDENSKKRIKSMLRGLLKSYLRNLLKDKSELKNNERKG